jgi:fibronectin type 3 domain-containing protein
LRKGPNDKSPVQIGTAEKPEYVDTTSQWDTPYTYTVVAQQGSAESLPSTPVAVIYADKFPPSIPATVTALAAPDSIEVSWSRSPESDLKGYYVYRSVDGGPFVRQGDLINLPVYSDHKVEHGKTYRYAISATDQKNNESEKSAAAEVVF